MFTSKTLADLAKQKGYSFSTYIVLNYTLYGKECESDDRGILSDHLRTWLRNIHNYEVIITPNLLGYDLGLLRRHPWEIFKVFGTINIFQTYEDALEEGLKQLLNKLEDE